MGATPLDGSEDIGRALTLVGELLAAEGEAYAVVIIGGAALNLLGIVRRTTNDVDIVGFGERRPDATWGVVAAPAPLPETLVKAIRTVARDLHLGENWMNAEPALQARFGFPAGMERRIHWRNFESLRVGIADRTALICFKLHAAVDNAMQGRHERDLMALNPTDDELDMAAAWVRTQDAGPDFPGQVGEAVEYVRAKRRSRQR